MATGLMLASQISAITDDDGTGTTGTIFDQAWMQALDAGTTLPDITNDVVFDQGAGDTDIHQYRSSDVAHGMTTAVPTDAYFAARKWVATTGGAWLRGFSEDEVAFGIGGYATNDNTTKTAAGEAYISISASKKTGTTAGAVGANANIVSFENNFASVFLIDAEGDWFYDGADGGAFDEYDDAHLARAFSLVAGGAGVVRSKWDEMVQYNEGSLVEAGILGAPVSEGGLVNGAQLQRLLVGATWQLYTKLEEQAERIAGLERLLEA